MDEYKDTSTASFDTDNLSRRTLPSQGRVVSLSKHAPTLQPLAGALDTAVEHLQKRALCLRRCTLWLAGSVLGILAISGGFYVMGMLAEPSAAIAQFVLPEHVLRSLQAADRTIKEPALGLANIEPATGALFSGTPIRLLSALFIVVGLAHCLITQRLSTLPAVLIIGTLPFLLGTFLEDSAPPHAPPSELGRALEAKRLPALQQLLAPREDLSEGAKAFVLAQAAIVEGVNSPWIARAAQLLRESGAAREFAVPARYAYAIETLAGPAGTPLTPAAEAYRQAATQTAERWACAGDLTALLAGVLGLLTIGYATITQTLARRVRRIGQLLATSS